MDDGRTNGRSGGRQLQQRAEYSRGRRASAIGQMLATNAKLGGMGMGMGGMTNIEHAKQKMKLVGKLRAGLKRSGLVGGEQRALGEMLADNARQLDDGYAWSDVRASTDTGTSACMFILARSL